MTVLQLRNIGGGMGELREPSSPPGTLCLAQKSCRTGELSKTPLGQSLLSQSIESPQLISEGQGQGGIVKNSFPKMRDRTGEPREFLSNTKS